MASFTFEWGISTTGSSALLALRMRVNMSAIGSVIQGYQLDLVTPGIRPAGSEAGDQKRVTTPSDAIRAGADYLVVARPIIRAPDPRAAAEAIQAEIAAALAD